MLRRTRIETHFEWEIIFSSLSRIIPFKMTCFKNSSYCGSLLRWRINLLRSSTYYSIQYSSIKEMLYGWWCESQTKAAFLYLNWKPLFPDKINWTIDIYTTKPFTIEVHLYILKSSINWKSKIKMKLLNVVQRDNHYWKSFYQ